MTNAVAVNIFANSKLSTFFIINRAFKLYYQMQRKSFFFNVFTAPEGDINTQGSCGSLLALNFMNVSEKQSAIERSRVHRLLSNKI